MMEKFEIKQEYKNMEGDPQIKGKRKEIAREIAYSEDAEGIIKYATVIIEEPENIAIAIAYNIEEDSAPYIVALGKYYMARVITKTAEQYKIPILANKELAQQLFDEGKVWEFIPETTYEAIADILKWLASLQLESENFYEKSFK
jgi:type III secretion protein U